MEAQSRRGWKLGAIRLLHTLVWVFFVGCILAIPVAGAQNRFLRAMVFTGIVLIECIILAMNRGHCPLTNLAGRYTDERADNFDIYLPLWLAKHNKSIFGTLFAAGEVFVIARWLTL